MEAVAFFSAIAFVEDRLSSASIARLMKQSFALNSCLFFATAFSALAYGPEGHKIVGGIADQRLAETPAGARVTRLLDGYTLEEVSIIADTIKEWDKKGAHPKVRKYFSSHPEMARQLREFWHANRPGRGEDARRPSHHWFHYTDVPVVGEEKYGDGRVGRSRWDIVSMMRSCIGVLEGRISEANERKITGPIAVILLAHLVGDIHQPLHVAAQYFDKKGLPANPDQVSGTWSDNGGNALRIKLLGVSTRSDRQKLHAFWDADAVLANWPTFPGTMEKEQRQAATKAAKKALMKRLATTEPKGWSSGEPAEKLPEIWANDTLPLARAAYARLHYENVVLKFDHGRMFVDGEIVEKEGDYSVPYRQWAAGEVLTELHKAGWRLADLLARIYSAEAAKTPAARSSSAP